jgi:hypothetical protein
MTKPSFSSSYKVVAVVPEGSAAVCVLQVRFDLKRPLYRDFV